MKNTGIYALYWESTGMVYVGQSQNMSKRFKEHLSSLKRGVHANPKMQAQYRIHGEPKLVVLETCLLTELYEKEIQWTAEFNALAEGLNIVEPGPSGWGTNSSQSKYSKIQVLRVFSLLTKTSLANIDIANKVGVSMRLVECIRGGYSHIWLKDTYPERYKLLEGKTRVKSTYARRNGSAVTLENNITGEVVEIDSVAEFARNKCPKLPKSFAVAIRRVVRGEQKEYMGWKLAKTAENLGLIEQPFC